MNIWDMFHKSESSKNVAKDRLKLLLVSDRASCSPEIMEMIKNDMIQVIAKYMEIDGNELDIQITHTCDNGVDVPALVANIPILQMKHFS